MITIITATYNAEQHLENLFKSLIPQLSDLVELVIIDGGSTDSTIDIIKKYSHYVSNWKSEKDKGIYDAWNKGLKYAKGEWIMFLGADDSLVEGAIEKYLKVIDENAGKNDLHFISSRIRMVASDGNTIRVKGWRWEWPKFLNEMTVAHPGALHSKKLFEEYGTFDISYKITGDYEMLLRPGGNLKTAFLDDITVNMSEGGASDSTKAIKEHLRAAINTGGASKISANINADWILIKFHIKKFFRRNGINVYLKR